MDITLVPAEIVGIEFNRLPVDFALEKGDLKKGGDLFNAILISVFTDARALDSDQVSSGYRGGWFGDAYLDTPIGSRLWLLDRQGASQRTANIAKSMVAEALNWMIQDRVVAKFLINVTVRDNNDGLNINIVAQKPDFTTLDFTYSYLWDQINNG